MPIVTATRTSDLEEFCQRCEMRSSTFRRGRVKSKVQVFGCKQSEAQAYQKYGISHHSEPAGCSNREDCSWGPKKRCKDNIKTDVREEGYEGRNAL